MKILVDYDLCQGHAVCMEEAPGVFEVNDDGELTLLQETPPAPLRTQVLQAVKYCPTQALTVVDGQP